MRGAIPLGKALDLAFQICDALAAAHASGVVHRDLKPENVMVTAEARVKVLDFGLAKRHTGLVSNAPSQDDNSHRTAAGTILGTVGYMSPEQAMGRTASTPRISSHSAPSFTKCYRAGESSNGRLRLKRSQRSFARTLLPSVALIPA